MAKKKVKKSIPRGNYQPALKIKGEFNEILKISGEDNPAPPKKTKKK